MTSSYCFGKASSHQCEYQQMPARTKYNIPAGTKNLIVLSSNGGMQSSPCIFDDTKMKAGSRLAESVKNKRRSSSARHGWRSSRFLSMVVIARTADGAQDAAVFGREVPV